MKTFGTFHEAISNAKFALFNQSSLVAPKTWQSVDVTAKPEMVTHEVQWWGFRVDLMIYGDGRLTNEDLHSHIGANQPWADNHFNERVCGFPLNPGTEWANWPYAKSADRFRVNDMFNHTYAERYWPRHADPSCGGETKEDYVDRLAKGTWPLQDNKGIRYDYGDLGDVINQLEKDPSSRQAVLPIFFPEDTGAVHGERVPCSIMYQFMIRNGRLDLFYYLRSCDFVRHFRDDIYLTLRLQCWVIEELQKRGMTALRPGNFLMQIASLHIFRNDWDVLFPDHPYQAS